MGTIYNCLETNEALTGLRLARQAIGRGDLVVLPTDTVYGIAADAFNPAAVQKLLDAKGRGRQSPPPVLVSGIDTATALAEYITPEVEKLADAFWPGGLTIVVSARSTLEWDLGETNGTVALRMPDHDLVRELLSETGPLAVSSANLTGKPAALTAAEALDQLGDRVSVYLDAGVSSGSRAGSTIVDATPTRDGQPARILREGTITREAIRDVLGVLAEGDE
ncbi:MAG: threonylcarbamoyl-AMP synthase [Actinobacteria bacterium]|nr:threonylcarbamoyl-AMP synthase [Actinomycetota bacterium]MUH53332.1 threonylcarbamoyl-AMP synthase [Actinomycetota bacterium]